MGLLLLWEEGHLKGHLRHPSCPQLHVWSAEENTGEETALWDVGPRGRTLRTIRTEGATPPEKPWVLTTLGGNQLVFFWTLGQLSLCLLKPLTHFPPDRYHNEAVWMSQMLLYQSSFKLQLELWTVFSRVSNHARVSLTPSGEGYTEQGSGLCFHEYGTHSLSEQNINPSVWADGKLWVEHKTLFCCYQAQRPSPIFTSKAVPTEDHG